MTDSMESAILSALKDIENGISQRKAAQRWGIPRTTLQSRLNGRQARSDAYESYQRLSKEQECHLVGWILVQTNLGLPPTHQQVKEIAQRIVKAGGNDQPLGKHWMEGFLRRNPEVRTVRGFLSVSTTSRCQGHPWGTSLQYGRDRDSRRPWQQRASARPRRKESYYEEATWFAMLDYNYRVYLGHRSDPSSVSHFQGLDSPAAMVSR